MKIAILALLAGYVLGKEYDTTQTEGGLYLTNEGAVFANSTNIATQQDAETLVDISRSTVISRAQDWVNRKIPYSQSKTTGIFLIFVKI